MPRRQGESYAVGRAWESRLGRRRLLSDDLRDRLGLREEQQIIRAARLAVRPRHVEASEGVDTDQRSRALAVDVEVARVAQPLRLLDMLRPVRVHRSRQTVLRPVGDLDRLVEVLRRNEGKDGPEDLLLSDPRVGSDVRDHGRLDEETWSRTLATAGNEAPLSPAELYVVEDLLLGGGVDDRPHVRFGIAGRTHDQGA